MTKKWHSKCAAGNYPNFRSLMKRNFFWYLPGEISIVFDPLFEEEVEPAGQNPL
jgi:hypothetical protein